MSDRFSDLLRSFLGELEVLGEAYSDITDTDVREALHLVISLYLVHDHPVDVFPTRLGMLDEAADKRLLEILKAFIGSGRDICEKEGIPTGMPRLEMIQDPNIVTAAGNDYMLFLGHADHPLDPELLPGWMFS